MNSNLNKAIRKGYWLQNKFLKTRSSESQKGYNKQRKFCLIPVKKLKREHCSKLDIKKDD